MKISRLFGLGVLGGVMSVSGAIQSCKKAPLRLVERADAPKEIVHKADSLVKDMQKISKDPSYIFFGRDTVEITGLLKESSEDYVNSLNKRAQRRTPKVKKGTYIDNMLFPKSGGGYDVIPITKPIYAPIYNESKAVISSAEIYTRTGKDLYVPVEYYGK